MSTVPSDEIICTLYDEDAKKCDPSDFHRQVKRTINGQPISQDQMEMILHKISNALDLKRNDFLLEFGCGNGYISETLFDACKGYLGIDLSDFLITIAKENFERKNTHQFQCKNIMDFIHTETTPDNYTKILFYAGVQYLNDAQVEYLFEYINNHFINISTIFIGNIPDKSKADKFHVLKGTLPNELNKTNTAIGVWRDKVFFEKLATKIGWEISISHMPDEFYSSNYRYDILLKK